MYVCMHVYVCMYLFVRLFGGIYCIFNSILSKELNDLKGFKRIYIKKKTKKYN